MKFQFITSVAAVLLSSGHGVFAAKSVRQNCQKEDNRSACARRLPCVWVEMEGGGGGWFSQKCCESTDVECILGYYLKDLIPTPPAPAPPTPRRPSRSQCVKLGEDAVAIAIIPMCQLAASLPWKDNSQLMDCRDIATQTCKNKLADTVMQSCGVNTNRQEVRRACTSAVDDLLGSAAVTED